MYVHVGTTCVQYIEIMSSSDRDIDRSDSLSLSVRDGNRDRTSTSLGLPARWSILRQRGRNCDEFYLVMVNGKRAVSKRTNLGRLSDVLTREGNTMKVPYVV